MKAAIKELVTVTENYQLANLAVTLLQGYAPQSDYEKSQLNLVRKTLIEMRDNGAEAVNDSSKNIEECYNDR